jgi:hypothetical protein
LCGAVVFELSVLNWRVLALEDVVQENPFAVIFGHGKAKRIRGARRRYAATAAGVAKIAEVAQRGIVGKKLCAVSAAYPAEASAQWQAMREGPADRGSPFCGEEVWASHNMPS